jgi:hypothetical protein
LEFVRYRCRRSSRLLYLPAHQVVQGYSAASSVTAFAIVSAANIGFVGDAKASNYDNGSGSIKPTALIEIGIPARHTLPLHIISTGPVQ